MNAYPSFRITAALAAAGIAAALAFAAPVRAADVHDHAAATPHKLSLDHGRRWATDASLRDGMARIRSLAETRMPAARAGRLGAADYRSLATGVETEVAGIVANCKLEPKADAMLHLLLADLTGATDSMAGKDARRPPQQGLTQLTRALDDYGRYFDDPTFRPARRSGGAGQNARAG
ncbi:MAG TPA: hypothetical protein VLJ62_13725 [Burkholderiaceae bacterium]|nr:hypothetical protein [Burkholderiaceae bacterium]